MSDRKQISISIYRDSHPHLYSLIFDRYGNIRRSVRASALIPDYAEKYLSFLHDRENLLERLDKILEIVQNIKKVKSVVIEDNVSEMVEDLSSSGIDVDSFDVDF